ncbi:MAG: YafY family transcriptional regulator [Deltaproteobacteria bacterium]|nr:YafY family transcriptional regulator [Deltaproteobacteria bacterium]MBN2671598.1 YafY family transcriptional regulator [Deltaproteobacteria bacterium]
MRRADRLFKIIQILRCRRLSTAAYLAEQLEISTRTVYRDINDLVCSGVPIVGEAGVGYALDKSFELPPLMFSIDEITALQLGARLVQSWADDTMARHAESALQKINQVLPAHLRVQIQRTTLMAVNLAPAPNVLSYFSPLRSAIDCKQILRLDYTDRAGNQTCRVVRPLCMTFFAPFWLLTAWCETRQDFRNFRLDRIDRMDVTDSHFQDEPGKTLADFLETVQPGDEGSDGSGGVVDVICK